SSDVCSSDLKRNESEWRRKQFSSQPRLHGASPHLSPTPPQSLPNKCTRFRAFSRLLEMPPNIPWCDRRKRRHRLLVAREDDRLLIRRRCRILLPAFSSLDALRPNLESDSPATVLPRPGWA